MFQLGGRDPKRKMIGASEKSRGWVANAVQKPNSVAKFEVRINGFLDRSYEADWT